MQRTLPPSTATPGGFSFGCNGNWLKTVAWCCVNCCLMCSIGPCARPDAHKGRCYSLQDQTRPVLFAAPAPRSLLDVLAKLSKILLPPQQLSLANVPNRPANREAISASGRSLLSEVSSTQLTSLAQAWRPAPAANAGFHPRAGAARPGFDATPLKEVIATICSTCCSHAAWSPQCPSSPRHVAFSSSVRE